MLPENVEDDWPMSSLFFVCDVYPAPLSDDLTNMRGRLFKNILVLTFYRFFFKQRDGFISLRRIPTFFEYSETLARPGFQ